VIGSPVLLLAARRARILLSSFSDLYERQLFYDMVVLYIK
jgi:hypothetical protein